VLTIGIDPGLSGAVAYIHPDGFAEAVDMPIVAYSKTGFVKNALDVNALAIELWAAAEGHRRGSVPAVVFMERVNAMPGQGVGSMFSLGMSYWGAAGVVAALGLPLNLIQPAEWKRHFRLDSNKDLARGLAARLFPDVKLTRKKDHGRAEALLIAKYGKTRADATGESQ
jgi:crossover junction endodeoxyribonuclease RuvC